MQINRASVEGAAAEGKAAVALFSAYYPSHGGGMELATWELANALLTAGMDIEWAAQADGEPAPGLHAHCRPLPGTDLIYALSGVPMPLPTPRAIPEISSIARRADVVVIVEANFILSVAAFLAARLHRKPILLIQHVGKPSTVSPLARLVMNAGETLAARPMVRGADAVVYVSPVVADYFEGERKASACLTIGHGVDMDIFVPAASDEQRATDRAALGLAKDGRLACFVGRLTESKGASVVAEMARLRPDWNFALAGKGPIEPNKWRLPNVAALGQLDRAEVARLYRASDATILPSPSESFSLVVREALASGSHVVCSPQILETDAGIAPYITTEPVDLSDVEGTAARFTAALERPARASSKQARAYITTQCSRTAVNERYVRLVKDLLRPERDSSAKGAAASELSRCR